MIWRNPLIDTAGYEPTALGMRTARPFVTKLASVTDPAGLLRLSRIIKTGSSYDCRMFSSARTSSPSIDSAKPSRLNTPHMP